ncbi:MAG TPA: PIG-L deacetylase family protein [Terracidiphilus sp.]
MQFQLNVPADRPLRVLCIGCHADDIEIGCGGTLLKLIRLYDSCELHWVVLSAQGVREPEARRAASLFAGSHLKDPVFNTFRDGFMPAEWTEVKSFFETELKPRNPDLILTHSRLDAHQDHRVAAELTWNTFRNHLILEYEIPKYDGDLGQPNTFVGLEREICDTKIKYLLECFASQRPKHWFDENTFIALMRLRGMECNSASGYAEAFYGRKVMF